jgi:hypothetical protein
MKKEDFLKKVDEGEKPALLVHGFPDSSHPVTVSKVTVEYIQESDCNSSSNHLQVLEITTEESGNGAYYVLNTDRWAFDSLDELYELLRDFEVRSGLRM